jgi:hypothetical protein
LRPKRFRHLQKSVFKPLNVTCRHGTTNRTPRTLPPFLTVAMRRVD